MKTILAFYLQLSFGVGTYLVVKGMNLQRAAFTLAGVTQCIECWPENQRVVGSIPSQGTCLGCGPGSQWGRTRDNHTLMFLSLSSSLPLSLKINKILKERCLKKEGLFSVFTVARTVSSIFISIR